MRDALQLKAEKDAFTVEHFDPESSGVLKKIQRELLPHDPNPISAQLHSVNVYQAGGHFAPHKDTPRGSDMFGTLVVCLPSPFLNGRFLLRHRGLVQRFDWGQAIQAQTKSTQVHWAAFFGDVDHEIERVWNGIRVTLTYLLRRGSGSAPANAATSEDWAPGVQAAWQALLTDARCFPKGGVLGYPCCHLYHQDARVEQAPTPITLETLTMLKGRDQRVAATALEAGLSITFRPYLFENCTDDTWELERFPTPQEKRKLGSQMSDSDLEKILRIRGGEKNKDPSILWLSPPPSSASVSRDSASDAEGAAAHLHSCEYCPWGYFGNGSSLVDFYTYAALHIAMPPFGEGARTRTEPGGRPIPTARTTSKGKKTKHQ